MDILEAIEIIQESIGGYDENAKVEIGANCEHYLLAMGNKYVIPSEPDKAKKLFESAAFLSGEWIETQPGDE